MIDLLAIVRSRSVRVAALVFQALWLNVIVPGHTRGIVQTPGSVCPECALAESSNRAAASSSQCHTPAHCPAGDPAAHCAICQLAVALSPPPVLNLTPPPLYFLEIHDDAIPSRPHAASFPLSYDGRAPPAPTATPLA